MTRDDFYNEWLKHFAEGISNENIERYVVSTGNYLWHVFSWELLDEERFLVGDSAKDAYNKIDKDNAIYIDWFSDDDAGALPHEMSTAEALDQMTEVYVAAPDFSWTYIKTHEIMCGPYFMKL